MAGCEYTKTFIHIIRSYKIYKYTVLCDKSQIFFLLNVIVMKVHENGQWLADDERYPHCRIAQATFQELAHEQRYRQLKYHPQESPNAEQFQRNADNVL